MAPVRTAVIPAAGLGTRFLPASKAIPKEMVPVVDKPTIQYIVEECVAAGIDDILIIVSDGKSSIGDHFDRLMGLEAMLESKGKTAELDMVRGLAEMADIHFIRQGVAKGLGPRHRHGPQARRRPPVRRDARRRHPGRRRCAAHGA